MPKASGLGDHFLIDGYDLSGDIGAVQNIGGGNSPLEVTGIVKLAPERLGGKRSGGIEFMSYFNPDAGAAHPVLAALPTTNRYASYVKGYVLGGQVATCLGKQVSYDPNRGEDGSLTMASSVTSDGYGLEWGIQASDGLRTDTEATDGDSIDNGASSDFGLQAYLHVESITGTSVTVKLQDSADDSSWADVTGGAFAAATARGAQRIATANDATVRRYLRVVTTGTFSEAVFLVQVTRNEIAGIVF